MEKCKDCIHNEVCDQSSRMMWATMEGKTECDDFKDRSRYVVREKGEWILDGNKILCSSCRTVFYELEESEIFGAKADLPYLKEIEKFCFNCGADMRADMRKGGENDGILL